METKRIELAASKAELSENTFVFEASTIGNPDRMGDVIMPGAFGRAVMTRAVEEGWADVSHGWEGQPIGMFDEIRMEGDTLVMRGRFHSTPRAQEMRTIVQERQAAGKKTSVSIGFMPNYEKSQQFESGAKLLEWAEREGYDMALLDAKTIKKLGWCRAIPTVDELFECSVCNVGMNPRAKVREVKQFGGDRKSRATTVGAILQAKIHQSFTVAADELAIRGYMDTDERIALSGNIGDSLKLFRTLLPSELADREIDPADVDSVAAKQLGGEEDRGLPLADHLDQAHGALTRAAEAHSLRIGEGKDLSPDRWAQIEAIHASAAELLARREPKAGTPPTEPDLSRLEIAKRAYLTLIEE